MDKVFNCVADGQISLFDISDDEVAEKYKKKKSKEWKWCFKDYPQKNGLNVFSFFSCGGGSTMGYKLAGCNVLGNCEIDEKMNKIYVLNHKPKYNFNMDIRDFNKLPKDQIPEELYHLDILDGSPPCTTFSMAGEREDSWGKKKKFREGQKEQTLDDLSFIFIETIKKLQPKTVIMENVEGLTFGEAWAYMQRIYKEMDEAGYLLNHWLLKGEEMGVPQTRHRVFFIAIRKDLNKNPRDIEMYFNYEPVPYGEIRSGSGRPLNKDTFAYKMISQAKHSDHTTREVCQRLGIKGGRFGHVIAWNEQVLRTITAHLDYTRGDTLESISVEDIISSQTFPQDYDFGSRSYSNVNYICGMSVPPLMTKRVTEKLIEFMEW